MTDLLTPQQARILPLLADGLTMARIGMAVYLAPTTVKSHIDAIRARLNATNAAHAVHVAHCLDLLDRPRTPEQKLALINEWLAEPAVARLVAAEQVRP